MTAKEQAKREKLLLEAAAIFQTYLMDHPNPQPVHEAMQAVRDANPDMREYSLRGALWYLIGMGKMRMDKDYNLTLKI